MKLAETVALALTEEIRAQGWPVGKVLGSESSFIRSMGVSRAVFREAVRLLEHHHVAIMRRGPGGGLVVRAPDLSSTVRAIARNLEYQSAKRADLLEVRSALELKAVELAAARMDDHSAERLRTVCRRQASRQRGHSAAGTHDIHREIAGMTGNPALGVFIDVIIRLTSYATSAAGDHPEMPAGIRQAHDGICEALVAGDSALARHRMRTHLLQPGCACSPSRKPEDEATR